MSNRMYFGGKLYWYYGSFDNRWAALKFAKSMKRKTGAKYQVVGTRGGLFDTLSYKVYFHKLRPGWS